MNLEGFKISDEAVVMSSIPPGARKVLAMLDSLPFKELLTTMQVQSRSGIAYTYKCVLHPALTPYKFKVGGRLLWGNRKTIIELKRAIAAQTK